MILILNQKGQVIFTVSFTDKNLKWREFIIPLLYTFIISRFGDINCYNFNTGDLSKVPKNAIIQTPCT